MSESGGVTALLREYSEKQSKALEESSKWLDDLYTQIQTSIDESDRRQKRWRWMLGGIAAVAGAALVWVGTQTPTTYWGVLVGELGKALLVASTVNVAVEVVRARTQGIKNDILAKIRIGVAHLEREIGSIAFDTSKIPDLWVKLAPTVDAMFRLHSEKLENLKNEMDYVTHLLSRVETVTEVLAPELLRGALQFQREGDEESRREEDPDAGEASEGRRRDNRGEDDGAGDQGQ